jgi:hypothetical protein
VVRLTELRIRGWVFRLWTPFNELGREEASSPGYRHAIERQRSRKHCRMGSTFGRERSESCGFCGRTMGPSL